MRLIIDIENGEPSAEGLTDVPLGLLSTKALMALEDLGVKTNAKTILGKITRRRPSIEFDPATGEPVRLEVDLRPVVRDIREKLEGVDVDEAMMRAALQALSTLCVSTRARVFIEEREAASGGSETQRKWLKSAVAVLAWMEKYQNTETPKTREEIESLKRALVSVNSNGFGLSIVLSSFPLLQSLKKSAESETKDAAGIEADFLALFKAAKEMSKTELEAALNFSFPESSED